MLVCLGSQVLVEELLGIDHPVPLWSGGTHTLCASSPFWLPSVPFSFPSSALTCFLLQVTHELSAFWLASRRDTFVSFPQRKGPAKQRPRRAERGSGLDTPARPRPKEAIEQNPRAVIGERCLRDAVTANALARRGEGRLPAVGRGNGRTGTTTISSDVSAAGSLGRPLGSCWVAGVMSSLLGEVGGLEWPSKPALLSARILCSKMGRGDK